MSPPRTMIIAVLFALAFQGSSQTVHAVDESFFHQRLYPVMQDAQCNLCHNDNGVAAGTALEFPSPTAGEKIVTAFGLKLLDLIDTDDPSQSLLLLKPTNREEHTGGERIVPGSGEEKLLLTWIHYLSSLTEPQRRDARAMIAEAEKLSLSPLTIRRLTNSQYNHTVRDLLGDRSQPANRFPKEDFVRGFKNQTETQGISPLHVEAYGKAAERLARGAFRGGDHLGLLPFSPRSRADDACAEAFIRQFGRRAFRRPLTRNEVGHYVTLLLEQSERARDFHEGAIAVVETMLQSPHFLFRIERAPGNEYEQYEIASRLSYLLWDTMPSDDMLTAAGNGAFSTVEQVEEQARRMLEDPRAVSSMEQFLAQWMRFDRVLGATRDRRRYRQFNPELAAAMVEETRRLFNHLVWEDKNFMEFYTADYTFLSAQLAKVYGLPIPEVDFAKINYPAGSGRAGVLGHGSFLVATSKPAETSPTERGLFIRQHFLSQDVPPPPPGVDTSLPEITEESPRTNRQRLDIHLNSEACASCHRLIDAIGLGLEQYDAIGAFHDQMVVRTGSRRDPTIVKLDLDTSGHIQGIEDSQFSSPKELGQILAKNELSQKAIVKQLFRYAFGRQERMDDQPTIDTMLSRFRDSGFRFQELIIATVTSDLFLQRG